MTISNEHFFNEWKLERTKNNLLVEMTDTLRNAVGFLIIFLKVLPLKTDMARYDIKCIKFIYITRRGRFKHSIISLKNKFR